MTLGRVRTVAFLYGCTVASLTTPARAEEPAPAAPERKAVSDTERAANLYDQAMQLHEAAQYVPAAERFLEADAVVPSSEALSNAIASARRGDAPLLVARAARRAIARELLDPTLAERARVALNEAEPRLARLQARCAPQPCELTLNGVALQEASLDLLPGDYLLNARGPAGAASQKFTAAARTQYDYRLELKPAMTREEPLAVQQSVAAPTSPALDSPRKLPPAAFWIGVGATSVLTGLTVWSGLDTLNDEDALPGRSDPNYGAAADDLRGSVTRTDLLLAGTLVTAATTTAIGIWVVNWQDGSSMQVGAAPLTGGAALRWWGQFQ